MADILIQNIKGALTVRAVSIEGHRWLSTYGYETDYGAPTEVNPEDIQHVLEAMEADGLEIEEDLNDE